MVAPVMSDQPAPATPALSSAKPGYKTTEFWLTVATAVAGLLQAVAGALPPAQAAILITISTGLYTLSRGLAKK